MISHQSATACSLHTHIYNSVTTFTHHTIIPILWFHINHPQLVHSIHTYTMLLPHLLITLLYPFYDFTSISHSLFSPYTHIQFCHHIYSSHYYTHSMISHQSSTACSLYTHIYNAVTTSTHHTIITILLFHINHPHLVHSIHTYTMLLPHLLITLL